MKTEGTINEYAHLKKSKTEAEKALEKVKAIEAKKLKKGYRYIKTENRTWKLQASQ